MPCPEVLGTISPHRGGGRLGFGPEVPCSCEREGAGMSRDEQRPVDCQDNESDGIGAPWNW